MRIRSVNKNEVRQDSETLLNSLALILILRMREFHKVTGYQYNLIVSVVKNERLSIKIIMNFQGRPRVGVASQEQITKKIDDRNTPTNFQTLNYTPSHSTGNKTRLKLM